jgi:hypothetical protein
MSKSKRRQAIVGIRVPIKPLTSEQEAAIATDAEQRRALRKQTLANRAARKAERQKRFSKKKGKVTRQSTQSDTITPYMTFEVTVPSRLDKKRWSWKRENSAPGKVTVIKTGGNWK